MAMGFADRLLVQIDIENSIGNARIDETRKRMENLGKSVQQQARRMQQAMLSVGLSIMFTGMAIKRMADGALRSITDAYKQAIGDSGEFNVRTNQLAASWAFFKFSLMDALNQSGLLMSFVDTIIDMVNWFNNLSPVAKTTIVMMLVLFSFLGGLMMIVGQAALFTLAIIELWGPAAAKSFWRAFGALSIILAASFLLFQLWKTDGNHILKMITHLGIALLAAGGVALIFGASLAWPLLVFGALILAALLFKEELGIAFGYIMKLGIELGELLVKMIIKPLEAIIQLYNAVAGFLGKKTIKTPFSIVNSIGDGLHARVDARIEELKEERANRGSITDRLGFGEFSTQRRELEDQLAQQNAGTASGGTSHVTVNNYVDITNNGLSDIDTANEKIMNNLNASLDRYVPSTGR